MKLTVWTYERPPHVGALRVAAPMRGLHHVLHAPQGDTHADLLFTMIARRGARPPVTCTAFEARDLGSDTASPFKTACKGPYDRVRPQAMIIGASCTAELIQDDPAGLAKALALPIPVIPLDLPSYRRKEAWGAAETFLRLCRTLAGPCEKLEGPSCNLRGATALGLHNRDDAREIAGLLRAMGIRANAAAPLICGASRPLISTSCSIPRRPSRPAAGWRRPMASPAPAPCPWASARGARLRRRGRAPRGDRA